MNYKTNRLNHDFQILHFIAGSCHTPDAAYAILCDLKEDRSNAIKLFAASKLREEAKLVRAKKNIESSNESERLEAQADLIEIEAMMETSQKNYAAALQELAFIEKCMMALQPMRKFGHLPESEAHQAAQAEEWKLELIHRAENSLLTTGAISTDHFATMRLHPAFQSEILPAIKEMRLLLQDQKGSETLILRSLDRRIDLQKLLENPKDKSGSK